MDAADAAVVQRGAARMIYIRAAHPKILLKNRFRMCSDVQRGAASRCTTAAPLQRQLTAASHPKIRIRIAHSDGSDGKSKKGKGKMSHQ